MTKVTLIFLFHFFCSNAIFNLLSYQITLQTHTRILPTVIWHLLQLYEISFYPTAAAIPILWALSFYCCFYIESVTQVIKMFVDFFLNDFLQYQEYFLNLIIILDVKLDHPSLTIAG